MNRYGLDFQGLLAVSSLSLERQAQAGFNPSEPLYLADSALRLDVFSRMSKYLDEENDCTGYQRYLKESLGETMAKNRASITNEMNLKTIEQIKALKTLLNVFKQRKKITQEGSYPQKRISFYEETFYELNFSAKEVYGGTLESQNSAVKKVYDKAIYWEASILKYQFEYYALYAYRLGKYLKDLKLIQQGLEEFLAREDIHPPWKKTKHEIFPIDYYLNLSRHHVPYAKPCHLAKESRVHRAYEMMGFKDNTEAFFKAFLGRIEEGGESLGSTFSLSDPMLSEGSLFTSYGDRLDPSEWNSRRVLREKGMEQIIAKWANKIELDYLTRNSELQRYQIPQDCVDKRVCELISKSKLYAHPHLALDEECLATSKECPVQKLFSRVKKHLYANFIGYSATGLAKGGGNNIKISTKYNFIQALQKDANNLAKYFYNEMKKLGNFGREKKSHQGIVFGKFANSSQKPVIIYNHYDEVAKREVASEDFTWNENPFDIEKILMTIQNFPQDCKEGEDGIFSRLSEAYCRNLGRLLIGN